MTAPDWRAGCIFPNNDRGWFVAEYRTGLFQRIVAANLDKSGAEHIAASWRMRETLAWYADEANWRWDTSPTPAGDLIPGTSEAYGDHGEKARALLASLEKPK